MGLLGPFNEANRSLVEVLVQPCFMPFFRVVESIKIKVIQNIPRKYINFNKGIRGAFYSALVTKRAQQSAGERGLAGTEVTFQVDLEARHQVARQRCAQRLGGSGVGQGDGKMGR